MRNAFFGVIKLVIGFYFFVGVYLIIKEPEPLQEVYVILICFIFFFLGFTASYDGARHFFK